VNSELVMHWTDIVCVINNIQIDRMQKYHGRLCCYGHESWLTISSVCTLCIFNPVISGIGVGFYLTLHGSTDLYIYILDAMLPICVVSNQEATDKLTT